MWLTVKRGVAPKLAFLKAATWMAASVVLWVTVQAMGFAQGPPMGMGGPNRGMMQGNQPGMPPGGMPGGMPPGMRMDPNDPSHVLALKNELQLTNEQVNRLEKILAHARQLTEKVLTKEQKKKLQSLGPGMGGHMGPPPGFNPGGNNGPPPGFNPGGNNGPPPFNPGGGRGAQ
jgi:hypothetical protein